MAKDTTILSKIMILKRNLDKDWREDLEEINIYWRVAPLYAHIGDNRTANIILAFIALAYDASSQYLDPLKDRLLVKWDIMTRLAGSDCKTKEIFIDAVLGDSEDGRRGVIDKVIDWFIDNQKDWRWTNIISSFEFHSRAQMFANGGTSIAEMSDIAKMLDIAEKRREKANEQLDELRKEYMDIDTSLDKEKKPKLTERLQNNTVSWESWIYRKNEREKRQSTEDDYDD